MAFAAASWGLLVLALLPRQIVVLNDDFGYLKSVVETLQHHRPWTDDWLEPWSASLSVLSAALFRVTGSFYFSTSGLQAALAAVSFWALGGLLRRRGNSLTAAVLLAAVILAFPTFLWKALEFTGMVLYTPCFLLALWAVERRRWFWFFAAYAVAVASRQSAVTWLVLPGYFFLRALWLAPERRACGWLAPVLVIGAGAGWFLLLTLTMNLTHAQEVTTGEAFDHVDLPGIFGRLGAGALVYFLAIGVGAFFRTFGPTAKDLPRRPWRGPLIWVLVAATVAALLVDERGIAGHEFSGLGNASDWLYAKLLVVVAAAGWLGWRFRLRLEYVAGAAASLLLIGLRSALWDYYLLEVILFGIFSVAGMDPVNRSDPTAEEKVAPSFFLRHAAVTLIAAAQLLFLFHLKLTVDRAEAVTSVQEHALRSGARIPSESAGASFGYLGWHLYPYYITHDGEESRQFWGFIGYVQSSVRLGVQYDRTLPIALLTERDPGPDQALPIIGDETHRLGWFFHGRFVLQRRGPKPENDPVHSAGNFPLNDAEWRRLIESGR